MIKNGIFLFIFVFFTLAVFIPSYSKYQDLKERNAQLRSEIQALERKNKELATEKTKLVDDPVYLERVAREKMGIVREGEVVYKLRPEEKNSE